MLVEALNCSEDKVAPHFVSYTWKDWSCAESPAALMDSEFSLSCITELSLIASSGPVTCITIRLLYSEWHGDGSSYRWPTQSETATYLYLCLHHLVPYQYLFQLWPLIGQSFAWHLHHQCCFILCSCLLFEWHWRYIVKRQKSTLCLQNYGSHLKNGSEF